MSILARAALESGLALGACVAMGYALEELAARHYFGLHLVPLGPNGGADLSAASQRLSPVGEHGWLPLPLGVLDMALLLWDGNVEWRAHDSWWVRCQGAAWGQLRTLAVTAFYILPAVLAAWLLWMPWQCGALACGLAAAVAALSLTSLLFWLDLLPLLPRARVNDASKRACARRASLCLLHAAYFCARVVLGAAADGAAAERCSALWVRMREAPHEGLLQLTAEMQAQTPQGVMGAGSLLVQLVVACLAIHVVIDRPERAKEGGLWGAMD
jgi:hypothetical protein